MPNHKNNIPIFIISLKKDIAKKKHMQELCDKHNLHPRFIDAVDGKLLSHIDIDKIYSRKKALDNIKRELTKGEIGCALSHKKIYGQIIKDGVEHAIILEDDIIFDKGFMGFLNKRNNIPEDCDLLLLGHHPAESRDTPSRFSYWYKHPLLKHQIIRRPSEPCYGTYGYYLTKQGAKKLLAHLSKVTLPIDFLTGNSNIVNLYIMQNPIILIHEQLSKISSLDEDRDSLTSSIINNKKTFSRKVLEFIGLNTIINNSIISFLSFLHKIKPLRKYK